MALEPGENSHRARENLGEGRSRQYWLNSMAFGCFLVKLILNSDDHLRAIIFLGPEDPWVTWACHDGGLRRLPACS